MVTYSTWTRSTRASSTRAARGGAADVPWATALDSLRDVLVAEIVAGVVVVVVVVVVSRMRPDRAMNEPRRHAVHDDPKCGNDQHPIRSRSRALCKVRDRADDDQRGCRKNEQRIEHRRHGLGSPQAAGEARRRTANSYAYREGREPERGHVGQKMQRLVAQHVAVGPDGAGELHRKKKRHDREHDEHAPRLFLFVLCERFGARSMRGELRPEAERAKRARRGERWYGGGLVH